MSQVGVTRTERMYDGEGQPLGGRAPLRWPSLRSGSLRCARPPNGYGDGTCRWSEPKHRGTGILIVADEGTRTQRYGYSNCR